MNNFSRVLYDSTEDSLYNASLVPKSVESALRHARDQAREAIRSFFGKGAAEAFEAVRFQKGVAALLNENDVEAASALVKPKFRTQGSFSYHTHVDPETKPPQEIDIDDGMFLPVSFVAKNGSSDPQVASDLVFRITEAALLPLCEKNGWELVTNKASCVRIKLPNHAHLDIALYAVPDGEFAGLMEKAAKSTSPEGLLSSYLMVEEAYQSLSQDEIRLATRDSGWIASDPRLLEDWFNNAVAMYGDCVRIASRIFKVWRDCADSCDRLASIALMYAVVHSCENGVVLRDDRFDQLIADIAERLPGILASRIPNPRVDGAYLDQNWSDEERKIFVKAANDLSITLNRCLLENLSTGEIIASLKGEFGRRVPEDKERVTIQELEKKSLAVPAYVSETAAADVKSAVKEIKVSGGATKPFFKI